MNEMNANECFPFHIRNNNCTLWGRIGGLEGAPPTGRWGEELDSCRRNEKRSLLELFWKIAFEKFLLGFGSGSQGGWNGAGISVALRAPQERCWFDERKMVTQKAKFHRLSMPVLFRLFSFKEWRPSDSWDGNALGWVYLVDTCLLSFSSTWVMVKPVKRS